MKKILIIINNFGVGGAERLVIDTANELLKRENVSCCVITLRPEPQYSLMMELDKRVVCQQVFFKGLLDLQSWLLLYRHVRYYRPSVIFSHLWFSNTIGRIIGFIARVPRIVSFEHNIYDNVKTKKMFFIDWSLQVVSHKIIAVSESVKHSLLSHGIRQDKIEVLLNGLDLSRYGHTRTDVLDGKIKTSFTFVFIGRLIYQKGVDVLLKAFAMLKEGELLITGQGQGKESLIKMTEDLGIKDRVKFLGVRKDIPNILSYSDCFILPSRFEGLGMVVLEAMASNTVIIIADFSAGIEMIRDGYNGLVFQREDSLGLAKKMRESLTVNRQRFYDNNKNLIQKFSISIYVDKLILI